MRFAVHAGLLAVAAALLGCGASSETDLRVFAASSLTEVMEALATDFTAGQDVAAVGLHFDGTPRLLLQLREGAPADVLATADAAQMTRAKEAGLLAAVPRLFARNRLALVVGAGNPTGIRGLSDLARDDLRVGLCGAEVPAGRYARQLLKEQAVTIAVCSEEPSVRALLAKIALGEVDAGLAYMTDLGGSLGRSGAIEAVPLAETAVRAEYFVAPLRDARSAARASAWVDFLLSTEGRHILQAHGFDTP